MILPPATVSQPNWNSKCFVTPIPEYLIIQNLSLARKYLYKAPYLPYPLRYSNRASFLNPYKTLKLSKALKEKQAAVKVEEKKPTPVVLKPIYSQKPSDKFKEILITCNYAAEPRERKRKMLCKLPHFILYDTADLEHSQVIRMIFAVARIPYELKKVEPAEIIDLPLRTVPALEIDGAKIGNITTICRHLGWRYDHIEYRNVDYSKPECSDRYAFEYLETQLAPVIENLLHKNTSPWLIGQKLTWSDLMTAAFFNSIIYHRPAFFDRYPNIYLHNKKIAELPELEGMLYCVRDRTVEVSLFSHMTKPPMETQMTACT
ncbi:unnamed protein product, partial [Mesorhabditis spiculigera]